jgi:hypothetical protein
MRRSPSRFVPDSALTLIEDTSYRFEVHGESLEQLGERAVSKARELYGDRLFRITSMDVSEDASQLPSSSKFVATVYTGLI